MTIIITAGPTREAIDPVRYLSNRSSGKMGYAIARAAQARSHEVILISGPTSLPVPEGIDFTLVESAAEMYQAVADRIAKAEVAIFSAAVADYRPVDVLKSKLKKGEQTRTLELERTSDILGSARTKFSFTGLLVGFAAETENLEENASNKLQRKGCDLVVANDVSRNDIGFDSSENEIVLVYPDRITPLPKATKEQLGYEIIELLETLIEESK